MDALRHALAGQDWGYATRLLVDNWHHLVRYGHDDPLPVPVPPPPVEAIRADPELALACAADRLDLRDLDLAEGYLRLADRHRHLLAADRQDRFALIGTALRLAQAQQRGDAAQMRSAATGMLTLLGQADPVWPAAVLDPAHAVVLDAHDAGTAHDVGAGHDVGAEAIALTALGLAELSSGDLAAAEAALTDGLVRAEGAGLSCARLVGASTLAFVQAARGELRAAERTARAALRLPSCPGQARTVHRGYAYLALAVADLQWDRLDLAHTDLDLAATAGGSGSDPALAAAVAVVSAQLCAEEGDLARGYEVLRAGRREVADRPPSQLLERWFAAVGGGPAHRARGHRNRPSHARAAGRRSAAVRPVGPGPPARGRSGWGAARAPARR